MTDLGNAITQSNGTAYISFSAVINQATTESLLATCGQLTTHKAKTVYSHIQTPNNHLDRKNISEAKEETSASSL